MWKAFTQEYRSHAWARFTFWILVFGLILWILSGAVGYSSGLLWFVFGVCAFVAGIYYVIRFVKYVLRRMLWRLTSRLVVTYLFIAFVPVILIILLAGLGMIILSGQFAAFLVNGRLQNHFEELRQLNRVVAHQASRINTENPPKLCDALEEFYEQDLGKYAKFYPGLEITLRAGREARAFRLTGEPASPPVSRPPWLKSGEWAGMAINRGAIFLRAVDGQQTKAGFLTLILSMPMTPALLNAVGEGIGPVAAFMVHPRAGPRFTISLHRPAAAQPEERQPIVQSTNVPLPPKRLFADLPVHGVTALNPAVWNAPQFREDNTAVVLGVSSRILALNAQLLSLLGRFSSAYVVAFAVIAIVFLLIELSALIIGILLTRSITSTVARLQSATEHVKAGDFSYRVALPARDQVSALGSAFDTMTASVERLMAESREKLRLENELTIAHEVQQQLFPQRAPEAPGAHMFGECRPARGVSGDYYDFMMLNKSQVGLALGDVSGKGIYAALLMAGIQSAVRAQLYDGHGPAAGRGAENAQSLSTGTMLGRLNRQVYENTPDAKYATLFYAIFDAEERSLLYTNAGHPPPLLFRRHSLLRLDAGGTVLGLFPTVQYQQQKLQMEPGDVVVAFTDGLLEPENSFGEEFGEARLIKAIREGIDSPPEVLADSIYQEILDWTGGGELQDDMTMLYLKTTA